MPDFPGLSSPLPQNTTPYKRASPAVPPTRVVGLELKKKKNPRRAQYARQHSRGERNRAIHSRGKTRHRAPRGAGKATKVEFKSQRPQGAQSRRSLQRPTNQSAGADCPRRAGLRFQLPPLPTQHSWPPSSLQSPLFPRCLLEESSSYRSRGRAPGTVTHSVTPRTEADS